MCQPIRVKDGHIGYTWSSPQKDHLQPFLRGSRKCVCQSEARVAILVFVSTKK